MFITGDLHGEIDINKLNTKNFPIQKNLTKDNFLIVAGDFGLVFDKSRQQKYWQEWLGKKNFTTLFVDGNHENFDLLNEYPVTEWCGGKVHKITDSIIHLMRGQVFTIKGQKIFTFGGAESIDKMYRMPRMTWWEQEMPSHAEYEEGLKNLEKHNWEVDYIITHECSNQTFNKLAEILFNSHEKLDLSIALKKYFDVIEEKVKYKHWYFGHYHASLSIDEKHTLLYREIKKLDFQV